MLATCVDTRPPARPSQEFLMPGSLGRLLAALVIGWFVFLFAAMGLAFLKKRDAPVPEPEADEVDLVAAFAPLDFRSTSSAFRGGRVDTWFGGGVLDLRDATLDPMGAPVSARGRLDRLIPIFPPAP